MMSNCKLCLADCAFKGKDMKKGNCKGYIPMSNADRIRAMSDEELSEWLCQALDCDFCKAYLQNMSIYSCCENQVKGTKYWLQQPAVEDT